MVDDDGCDGVFLSFDCRVIALVIVIVANNTIAEQQQNKKKKLNWNTQHERRKHIRLLIVCWWHWWHWWRWWWWCRWVKFFVACGLWLLAPNNNYKKSTQQQQLKGKHHKKKAHKKRFSLNKSCRSRIRNQQRMKKCRKQKTTKRRRSKKIKINLKKNENSISQVAQQVFYCCYCCASPFVRWLAGNLLQQHSINNENQLKCKKFAAKCKKSSRQTKQ